MVREHLQEHEPWLVGDFHAVGGTSSKFHPAEAKRTGKLMWIDLMNWQQ